MTETVKGPLTVRRRASFLGARRPCRGVDRERRPLFYGLVNGGAVIGGEMPGAWAILLAALVGRPAGILVSIALALAVGLRLPLRLHRRELIVVSLAASAGFTFAPFLAASVIPAGPLLNELELGALSTAVSAILAFAAARLLHVGRFSNPIDTLIPPHPGR